MNWLEKLVNVYFMIRYVEYQITNFILQKRYFKLHLSSYISIMVTCIKWNNLRKVQGFISTERPIPIIEIRLSHHHLIFIMGIYIVKATSLKWDGPWCLCIIGEYGITGKHI